MSKFKISIATLVLSLLVPICAAIPGYAAGGLQGVTLELVQEGSGYEVVIPGYKEVGEMSFVGVDGQRQTEKVIVMGAPDPDGEGRYPLLQVVTTHGDVRTFEARLGTYQDGELSHFEAEFTDGQLVLNPALAVQDNLTEFARNKVFNLDFIFYDKDKNKVLSVTDINILFVDKREIPAEARPSSSKVVVNGREIAFEAYNIAGNNYFKLRDLAKALDGSGKQFAVGWDDENNAIRLLKHAVYEADGTELAISGKLSVQTAQPSAASIYIDGLEAELVSYNIDGYNYFKLRDLAKWVDFNVTWDDERNTVGIDTESGYVEPED